MRRLAALHAGGGRLQPLGRGRARDPRRLRQQRSGCYRARLLEAGVAARLAGGRRLGRLGGLLPLDLPQPALLLLLPVQHTEEVVQLHQHCDPITRPYLNDTTQNTGA